MRIRDLPDHWREAGERPRTADTYELRLAVDDAAKIHALADMYPGHSREEILMDLLACALAELEESMPYVPGPRVIAEDDHGDPIYEDAGPTPEFGRLTRHYKEQLARSSG